MSGIIEQLTEEKLKEYYKKWKERESEEEYSNPSLSYYTSMVYGFAKHLPYSMDIMQDEYVPADFFNMVPFDKFFNWEEEGRNYFNVMTHWGDTFISGMLLQVCFIFQKMLLGEFPNEYEIKEENYTEWKIDAITENEEYNKSFFEILKALPGYYRKVTMAKDNQARRKMLNECYQEMMVKIGARFGGFIETDEKGNVVREEKANILLKPHKDIELFVYAYSSGLDYYDGIDWVTQEIKEGQLIKYSAPKALNNTALEKKLGDQRLAEGVTKAGKPLLRIKEELNEDTHTI